MAGTQVWLPERFLHGAPRGPGRLLPSTGGTLLLFNMGYLNNIIVVTGGQWASHKVRPMTGGPGGTKIHNDCGKEYNQKLTRTEMQTLGKAQGHGGEELSTIGKVPTHDDGNTGGLDITEDKGHRGGQSTLQEIYENGTAAHRITGKRDRRQEYHNDDNW